VSVQVATRLIPVARRMTGINRVGAWFGRGSASRRELFVSHFISAQCEMKWGVATPYSEAACALGSFHFTECAPPPGRHLPENRTFKLPHRLHCAPTHTRPRGTA